MKNLKLYFLILSLALHACKANDLTSTTSKLKGSWLKKETYTNLPFVSNAPLLDTLIFNDFLKHRNVLLLNKVNPIAGSYEVINKSLLRVTWISNGDRRKTNFMLKYVFRDDENLILQYGINTPRGRFYVNSSFEKIK